MTLRLAATPSWPEQRWGVSKLGGGADSMRGLVSAASVRVAGSSTAINCASWTRPSSKGAGATGVGGCERWNKRLKATKIFTGIPPVGDDLGPSEPD
jgi:hypothetical protein